MKKIFSMFLVLIFININALLAEDIKAGSLGAGLSIGLPTGFAMKYWLTDKTAIAGVLGATNVDGKSAALSVQVDYLFHNFDLIKVSSVSLPVHYGFGFWVSDKIGVRGVVGLSYFMKENPLDFYIDLAPSLSIVGDVGFNVSGAIGGRYYF